MSSTKVLTGLAIAAAVPLGMYALGNSEQKQLAWDLTSIGLISTGIGTLIGLWAVPEFRDRPWVAAVLLTAASYAVKAQMLPHGSEEEHSTTGALEELGAVYR